MSYYYKILLLSLIIPAALSFDKRIEFNKKFSYLFKATIFASLPFVIWDIFFTKYKVWGFNENFVSGFKIINLPIEEVLFFFIIPFCCIFNYHILKRYNFTFFNIKNWKDIHLTILVIAIFISLLNISNIYTFVCLLFFSSVIIIEMFIISKINLNYFYSNFIIMLIPFTFVNGALTGLFFDQTVVWYNTSEIMGIYFFTIPVEDIIYMHQMLLLYTIFYEKYSTKQS